MITREIKASIQPTSREIENEIWEMDTTKQTDLILAMGQRYKRQCADVCMQLEYLKDEVNELLTEKEKMDVIQLFEQIVDYIKNDKLSEKEQK